MDKLTRIFQGKVMGLENKETGAVQMEEGNITQQVFNVGETAEQEANRKIGLSFGSQKNGYELTGLGGGGPSVNINSLIGLGSGGPSKNVNDFIGLGSGSSKKKKADFDVSKFFATDNKKTNPMLGGVNNKISGFLGKAKNGTFNTDKFFKNTSNNGFTDKFFKNTSNNGFVDKFFKVNKNKAVDINKFFVNPTANMNVLGNLQQHIMRNPVGIATQRVKQQRNLSLFGDYDGDKVFNLLDCQPLNRKRQGPENNTEEFIGDEDLKDREASMYALEEELAREEAGQKNQKLIAGLTDEEAMTAAELKLAQTRGAITSEQQARELAAMDIARKRGARDVAWRQQYASMQDAERQMGREALATEVAREQVSKPGWMQAIGMPTWKEYKEKKLLQQQTREEAQRMAYTKAEPELYRKQMELELARQYPQEYELAYAKGTYKRDKKGKLVKVKEPKGTAARASSAMVTAASAFGGGGAMGGADAASYRMASMMGGGSGGGFGAMIGGVGSGMGFGAMVEPVTGSGFGAMTGSMPSGMGMTQMLGQQPVGTGMGMARMVGQAPSGSGFAYMAGLPQPSVPEPVATQMPMQPTSMSQPVAPVQYNASPQQETPSSTEGKIWSPHSKRYVRYPRGPYKKY